MYKSVWVKAGWMSRMECLWLRRYKRIKIYNGLRLFNKIMQPNMTWLLGYAKCPTTQIRDGMSIFLNAALKRRHIHHPCIHIYSAASNMSMSFLMIIVWPAYRMRSGDASIHATLDTFSPGYITKGRRH